MKNYNPTELENIMIEILMCGQSVIWQDVEDEKDPINRCKMRKLFTLAIQKIKES